MVEGLTDVRLDGIFYDGFPVADLDLHGGGWEGLADDLHVVEVKASRRVGRRLLRGEPHDVADAGLADSFSDFFAVQFLLGRLVSRSVHVLAETEVSVDVSQYKASFEDKLFREAGRQLAGEGD